MKIAKVKMCTGSEIIINLDHVDYVSLSSNSVYFIERSVMLNDESMKKVVELLESEEGEKDDVTPEEKATLMQITKPILDMFNGKEE